MQNKTFKFFRLGDCRVHCDAGTIETDAGSTRVEPKAMAVLVELAKAAGETVSRATLISAVWGHRFVTDDVLTRCISQLRKALNDTPKGSRYLETVPKRGYRLVATILASGGAERTSTVDERSLAVLPIGNLTGKDGNEFIADGLTELLIARLASLESLRVISRASAMHFKNSNLSLGEIAGRLDVQWVVEGSLLTCDDEIRIVIRLIDAAADKHLWAESFARPLSDMVRILDEIAQRVTVAVDPIVRPSPRHASQRSAGAPTDRMLRYLRGRHLLNQRTADSIRKAMTIFDAAISADPADAAALAGLADACTLLAIYGIEPEREAFPRARQYALRAIGADPHCVEAHAALATAALFHDWDTMACQRALDEVFRREPDYGMGLLVQADLCAIQRRFNENRRAIKRALACDPLNIGLNMNAGDFLILERCYGEAIVQLENTLDLAPSYVPGRLRLAFAMALAGHNDAARTEMDTAESQGASPEKLSEYRAIVAGVGGDASAAQDAFENLETIASQRHVAPWALARAAAAFGDADRAFAWLARAIDSRSASVIFLPVTPAFDPVRSDPRLDAALMQINLDRAGPDPVKA